MGSCTVGPISPSICKCSGKGVMISTISSIQQIWSECLQYANLCAGCSGYQIKEIDVLLLKDMVNFSRCALEPIAPAFPGTYWKCNFLCPTLDLLNQKRSGDQHAGCKSPLGDSDKVLYQLVSGRSFSLADN